MFNVALPGTTKGEPSSTPCACKLTMSLPPAHREPNLPSASSEPADTSAPYHKPLNFGTDVEGIDTSFEALSGAVVGGIGSAGTVLRQALGSVTSASPGEASQAAGPGTTAASTGYHDHDALATGAAAHDPTLADPAAPPGLIRTFPGQGTQRPATLPETGNGHGGEARLPPLTEPPPGPPVPCEAFDFDMDLIEKILAEQRASQAVQHASDSEDPPTQSDTAVRQPLPARASSMTLPSEATPTAEDVPSTPTSNTLVAPSSHSALSGSALNNPRAHPTSGNTLLVDRPPSSLSVTSVKSGVLGTTPQDANTPESTSNVANWSADVAEASRTAGDDAGDAAAPPPSDERTLHVVPATRAPAKRSMSARVVPLYDGFYLTEPSPPVREQEPVPRLAHTTDADDSHSHSDSRQSDVGDSTNEGGLKKRVSLSKRIRGEAKVIAGRLRKDDAKVAEGRAMKGGELP